MATAAVATAAAVSEAVAQNFNGVLVPGEDERARRAAAPELAHVGVQVDVVALEARAGACRGSSGGGAYEVGQRVVGKAALVAALQEHLQQWARGGAVASRHEAYAGLLPAELLGLAGLADEGASFYLCRSFEVAPGVTLKPSWSLGVYLSRSSAPPPPPSPLEHS